MVAMVIRRHLAVLALLLSCCARAPEYVPELVIEARHSDAPAPRSAALLRHTMLERQNRARAEIGSPPLSWDDDLAAAARAYAQEMARTGKFRHARQTFGPTVQGENLWTGTRDAYRFAEMNDHWVAEKRHFINRITPDFSRTGRWEDVGHYAQMVWRGTTRIGCAMASNRQDDFLVCRYSPAGNVVGERAF